MPSREEVSVMVRKMLKEDAQRLGNENTIHVTINSAIWAINRRFLQSDHPGQHFEIDMHEFWHKFHLSAMYISPDHPAQDRLVFDLLSTREYGALVRQPNPDRAPEPASTEEGIIWKDLPYLVSDTTKLWTQNCAVMSAAQRLNLSAFLARLASVGVADNRISGIGLMVLRETLEIPRPLGQLNENQGEDETRAMSDLTVAMLLPAAQMWLIRAGTKVLRLSEAAWNDCPLETGCVGDLVQQEPSMGIHDGFSAKRWWFWLRRLGEIAEESAETGDSELQEFATRTMDTMISFLENIHSSIGEESGIAGRFANHRPRIYPASAFQR